MANESNPFLSVVSPPKLSVIFSRYEEFLNQCWLAGELTLAQDTVGEFLERVGAHIYFDYQSGRYTFEECEASLNSLNVCEDLWIGMPS